jgi:hypothetical protein
MMLTDVPRSYNGSAAEIWHFRFSAATGASVGSALVRRHFGLPGVAGWARALLAFCIALFAGGSVGGLLNAGFFGALGGPMVPVAATQSVTGAVVVLLAPFAALQASAKWRACRDGANAASAPPVRSLRWWIVAMLGYAAFVGQYAFA